MTVQVDFWHLVGLLLSFIATLGGFGMLMLRQIDGRIDGQNARLVTLEKDLADHKARLPLEYQRREDAIRFETGVNAKLDAIYNLIERIRG
jgi:hypothetical protein